MLPSIDTQAEINTGKLKSIQLVGAEANPEIYLTAIRFNYPHINVHPSFLASMDDFENVIRLLYKKFPPGYTRIYRVSNPSFYHQITSSHKRIICTDTTVTIYSTSVINDPSARDFFLDWDDRFQTLMISSRCKTEIKAAEITGHLVNALVKSVRIGKLLACDEQLHELLPAHHETTVATKRYRARNIVMPDSALWFRSEMFLPLWYAVVQVGFRETLTHMEEKVARYLFSQRNDANRKANMVVVVHIRYPSSYESIEANKEDRHIDVYFYTLTDRGTEIIQRGHSSITDSPDTCIEFSLAWARPGLNKFIEYHDWKSSERQVPVIKVIGDDFYNRFVHPLFQLYEEEAEMLISRHK
ncbi:uncharacterized protein V2V93DRAFT_363754 [Kockiozyma suomiensis]|uniref:uncharacterized protein n=1 Tax=Kockiozyma suomiensis TaxID=1337062 RepID=UPI0033439D35